jgi:uncharacterized delta-60 repeat protein
LDGDFDPDVGSLNPSVFSVSVQADQKILVAGFFDTLAGQPRQNIGRLDSDGLLDNAFNPATDDGIYAMVVQTDGKILVAGRFTLLAGHPHNYLGRLNADGSPDDSFAASANDWVYSLTLQADGKILVGGWFTALNGVTRNYIGRLFPDGSLDPTFNPGAGNAVYCLAVQADGKILVGGLLGGTLGGQPRDHIGRLTNGGAALQSLSLDALEAAVLWSRSGSGPEVEQVTFEKSNDGVVFTQLGSGARTSAGWRLMAPSLPVGQSFFLRARGRATGGQYNGSSGLIESVRQLYVPPPRLINPVKLDNGAFQFSFTNLSSANFSVLATTNLVLPSSNWTVLGSPTCLGGSLYQFTDFDAANHPQRFYKLRLP